MGAGLDGLARTEKLLDLHNGIALVDGDGDLAPELEVNELRELPPRPFGTDNQS